MSAALRAAPVRRWLLGSGLRQAALAGAVALAETGALCWLKAFPLLTALRADWSAVGLPMSILLV